MNGKKTKQNYYYFISRGAAFSRGNALFSKSETGQGYCDNVMSIVKARHSHWRRSRYDFDQSWNCLSIIYLWFLENFFSF